MAAVDQLEEFVREPILQDPVPRMLLDGRSQQLDPQRLTLIGLTTASDADDRAHEPLDAARDAVIAGMRSAQFL